MVYSQQREENFLIMLSFYVKQQKGFVFLFFYLRMSLLNRQWDLQVFFMGSVTFPWKTITDIPNTGPREVLLCFRVDVTRGL